MHSLMLYALLALGGSPEAATSPALDNLPSGSLVFLENCNSVVRLATRGKMGHVAIALLDGSESFIYEATPAQVRRVTAAEYSAELARLNRRRDEDDQIRIWAVPPKKAYSEAEVSKLRTFLDEQVGRRYSVRNYVRDKPGEGIHCAELASTALNQTGRHSFDDCHTIHPQALYAAMLPISAAPQEVAIAPPAVKESWCVRSQRRASEWFTWCGWSCGEAWAWCW
jgi:hypothetical protein